MPDDMMQKDKGYNLTYESNGVYLTVYKPLDFFSRVSENEVLNTIRKKKIQNYNANIIADAVNKCEGVPVKIAEAQEEAKIDSSVEAIVSQDKMSAFVILSPPEANGAPPTLEAIVQALYSKGVVWGMNESKIRELVENPVYNVQILVAEGQPAVNGKNGEVKYLFDIKKDRTPTILEDGTVNYKEMNLVESVTKGQKLAEQIPPIPGKPGKNLVGAELKALDGKVVNIPRGRNVVLSPDGTELFAAIDGQLMYVDGKINVFPTYEVMANVDNSTGNIKFIGNVTVRGNVLSGFEIEAGGNIEVNGVVEAAVLKAGGDIILKRGMHGNGKGMLVAGNDIVSKYIESANVVARNNIKCEAVMHCDIKCGNKLELGGRKGLLVGGTVRVGKTVELKYLGSQMSTATVLEVGIDPNLRERLKFLKGDLPVVEDNLLKSKQAITLLNKLKLSGELSMEKREILAKSTRTKFVLESRLQEYKKEIAEIEEMLQQGANGRIRIQGSVFPGVKVAIGNSTMYIKEEAQYCTLYSDGADIRFGPL
ncbi:MAG: DUF342 domain-containing protein [Clostridiaceae bacterium]|jgi:uncharacterized protein (DUF342 family)|nr:DUF342 domain-containing protein [Clostridiaceae bacterium]